MENRPLLPTDRTRFVTAIYPDSTPFLPAAGSEPTEIEALQMVRDYLGVSRRYADDTSEAISLEAEAAAATTGRRRAVRHPGSNSRGVDLFNSQAAKAKISSPALRAALVGLEDTIGEPAIDFILNAKTPEGLPKVKDVKFADLGDGVGQSIIINATRQMTILVNERYKAENPFLFTCVLAHEALHQDATVSNMEEVGCLMLHVIVYIQQLAKHPELAQGNTELTQRTNSNALARLQSGKGSRLGAYETNNNAQIFPGSPLQHRSWFDQFKNLSNMTDTPGNYLLSQIANRLTEPGKQLWPATGPFSKAFIDHLDQNQAAVTDSTAAAALKNLRMNTDAMR